MNEPEGFLLSADDVALLKQMKEFFTNYQKQTQHKPEDDIPQASQTYVARLPLAGLPALDDRSHQGQADRPGSTTCPIYKITYDDGVSAYVLENTGRTELVYNISEAVIKSKYTRITRDKFGRWIAEAYRERTDTGTGTGTGSGDDCVMSTIGGVSIADLPVSTNPGYILGVEGGCLFLVGVDNCS